MSEEEHGHHLWAFLQLDGGLTRMMHAGSRLHVLESDASHACPFAALAQERLRLSCIHSADDAGLCHSRTASESTALNETRTQPAQTHRQLEQE